MLVTDEDSLVCDLAEVYHIFDYKLLPASKVATLSVGLRENSRIKMKMNNVRHSLDTVLLAAAVDRMSLLLWIQTVDGAKGVNKPLSILDQLLEKEENKEIESFESPEDFINEWNKLANRGER